MPLVLRATLTNRGLQDSRAAARRRERLQAHIEELVKRGELQEDEARALESSLPVAEPAPIVLLALKEPAAFPACFHFRFEPAEESVQTAFSGLQVVEQPSARVSLDEKNTASITWVLAPQASSRLKPGTYRIGLTMDTTTLAADDGFRGAVGANVVELIVKPVPPSPVNEEKMAMLLAEGEYQLALRDWGRAAQAAAHVLAIEPESLTALELRGRALEGQGDLDGAAAAYSSAVEVFYRKFPGSYDAPLSLLRRLRDIEEHKKR